MVSWFVLCIKGLFYVMTFHDFAPSASRPSPRYGNRRSNHSPGSSRIQPSTRTNHDRSEKCPCERRGIIKRTLGRAVLQFEENPLPTSQSNGTCPYLDS